MAPHEQSEERHRFSGPHGAVVAGLSIDAGIN